jgi:uncharacterized protein (TIGR01777 family)
MARIAITGSSGFIGSALATDLRAHGHEVLRLVRAETDAADCVRWEPTTGALAAERLVGVEAVVHLAGENIAAGRWTAARRQRIRASRGPATSMLCASLAALPQPPALLAASAIGIYGDRGAEELDETSAPGRGFLAEVAQEWEAGALPLLAVGARVVHLRIGMVLGQGGGALGRLLLPFRFGLGGPLGNGRQYVSWIARADLLAIVRFLLDRPEVRGPVHCTAPAPVTNREFARTLGRALHRPAVLPAPAFALRLLLGAMADELLLASQRVVPRRLLDLGFAFACPDLATALAAEL